VSDPANGNGKRRRPRIALRPYDESNFNEFHEGNGKRRFTPAYNDFLEAIIFDKGIDIEERVMALALLTGPGNGTVSNLGALTSCCGFAVPFSTIGWPISSPSCTQTSGTNRPNPCQLCDRPQV
jgi:hypothetical protein